MMAQHAVMPLALASRTKSGITVATVATDTMRTSLDVRRGARRTGMARSHGGSRQHSSRRRWLFVMAGVVLVLLGHDALMAGHPHDSGTAIHSGNHRHSQTQQAEQSSQPGTSTVDATEASDCGVVRPLVNRPDELNLDWSNAEAVRATTHNLGPASIRAPGLVQSTCSPGDRRSLLQVFLL